MRVRLLKLIHSFKNKQVLLLIFLSFFITGLLLMPGFVFAWDFGIKDAIGEFLVKSFLGIGQALFKGGIWAVNTAISFMSGFINNNRLSAWNTVRVSALGLFGVALLAIAFMNLLRMQIVVWGANRMIPKLFLAVFLVIFSKFICISIINFSTALANTFLHDIAFNKFNDLVGNDDVMKIFNPDTGVGFITAITIFVFSAIAFLVLLVLAAILYFRAVVLALLIIISPLAFSLTVLPWTQKYFQEWWKNFLKWTFFFPICILILSVGFTLIPGQPDIKNPQASNVRFCDPTPADKPLSPPGCVPKYPSGEQEQEQRNTADSFFAMIASLFVALVAVVLSVYLPLKMLGAFGALAQGVLSGKKGIPGAPFDPKSIRQWSEGRSKKISDRKADRVGRMMRKPFGEGKFGTAITGEDAMDRAAIKDEKANMIKNNLTTKQQQALASNGGNINAIEASEDQKQWWNAFNSRGGTHEDVIRNLANEGNLTAATATDTNVGNFIRNNMDWDEAMKKSNLHQLRGWDEQRQWGTYQMGRLGDEQLSKMSPLDIQGFQQHQLTEALQNDDLANTVINSNKMGSSQKRAVSEAYLKDPSANASRQAGNIRRVL